MFLNNVRSYSMTKADFVTLVANKAGITKKDAATAIEAFTASVSEVLTKGDSISIIGFGTFSTTQRAARTARVPSTGKVIEVDATTVAKFKVGKNLKESVAASHKSCKSKKKCKK